MTTDWKPTALASTDVLYVRVPGVPWLRFRVTDGEQAWIDANNRHEDFRRYAARVEDGEMIPIDVELQLLCPCPKCETWHRYADAVDRKDCTAQANFLADNDSAAFLVPHDESLTAQCLAYGIGLRELIRPFLDAHSTMDPWSVERHAINALRRRNA